MDYLVPYNVKNIPSLCSKGFKKEDRNACTGQFSPTWAGDRPVPDTNTAVMPSEGHHRSSPDAVGET